MKSPSLNNKVLINKKQKVLLIEESPLMLLLVSLWLNQIHKKIRQFYDKMCKIVFYDKFCKYRCFLWLFVCEGCAWNRYFKGNARLKVGCVLLFLQELSSNSRDRLPAAASVWQYSTSAQTVEHFPLSHTPLLRGLRGNRRCMTDWRQTLRGSVCLERKAAVSRFNLIFTGETKPDFEQLIKESDFDLKLCSQARFYLLTA